MNMHLRSTSGVQPNQASHLFSSVFAAAITLAIWAGPVFAETLVVNQPATIDTNDLSWEGWNLEIQEGGFLYIRGDHTFGAINFSPKSGGMLLGPRVSASSLRVSDESHLWVQTCAVEVGGAFTVESNSGVDIAAAIYWSGSNWMAQPSSFSVDSARVDATSRISADGQGYPASPDAVYGPGAGEHGPTAGGGGYGGWGGKSRNDFSGGGGSYGSAFLAWDYGSEGGSFSYTTGVGEIIRGFGGNGGGLVDLLVTNTFQLDGLISANGDNAIDGGKGGGAGGSVRIEAHTLVGFGRLAANGGMSKSVGELENRVGGGGGGGGRIVVYYQDGSSFSGFTNATANGGPPVYAPGGDPGTVGWIDTSDTNLTVNVYQNFQMHDPMAGLIQKTNSPPAPCKMCNVLAFAAPIVALRVHSGARAQMVGGVRVSTVEMDGGEVDVAPGATNFSFGKLIATTNGISTIRSATGETWFDEIRVPAGARLEIDGATRVHVLGDVIVEGMLVARSLSNGATTTNAWPGPGVFLTASNIIVASGGSISADGQGYQQPYGVPGQGPGAHGPIGGAAHGGAGSDGGQTYGSSTQPVTVGSSGGGEYVDGWFAGTGGAGGGAIRLEALDTFTLYGTVTANGLAGTFGPSEKDGGGAGGSVWVEANKLAGSGTVSAGGGPGSVNHGGGGRIAVYYGDGSAFTGWTNATVAGGNNGGNPGQNGTLAFFDTSGGTNRCRLFIPHQRFVYPTNRELNLASITVAASNVTDALLDLSSVATLEVSNIFVDAGRLQLGDGSLTRVSGQITVANGALLTVGGGGTLEVAGNLHLSGTNSTLLVQGRNTSGSVSNLWLGEGGTILAASMQIDAGARLSGDGQGYVGAYGVYGLGPGAAGQVGGGGHGGFGATGGGPAYGVAWRPTTPGSSGGGAYVDGWFAGTGGSGGGAIHLQVTNTLVLDGVISANGLNAGPDKAGGGAGGSLWLELGTLTGAGRLSATGGNGAAYGGGGGGRIAVYYASASGFTGWTNATVLAGQAVASGQDGTLVLVDISLGAARPQWLVPAYRCDFPVTPPWFESLTIGSAGSAASVEITPGVSVQGGQLTARAASQLWLGGSAELRLAGTLSLLGSNTTLQAACRNIDAPIWGDWLGEGVFIQSSNLVIEAGASLTADRQGYYGAWDQPGRGPGGGGEVSGGSHGGYGGWGGPTYGLAETPSAPGTAGDGGQWRMFLGFLDGSGGNGGGAVLLQVLGKLTLDGVISANGGDGWMAAGGGAGGSLWLETGELTGTGFLSANGGNGSDYSGGGGGGRIALYSPQMAGFDPAHVTVAGGPYYSGGDGTIVIATSAPPLRVLAQTPTNTVNRVVDFMDLAFSAPLAETNFTTADLAFTTPVGPVVASQLGLSRLGANLWRVSLPRQTNEGVYTLTVGPNVTDLFGRPLASASTGTFAIKWPTISGTVRSPQGWPVCGVSVFTNGAMAAASDSNGFYAVILAPDWSGDVTAAMSGGVCDPSLHSYTNLTADLLGQDFILTEGFRPVLAVQRGGSGPRLNWPTLRGWRYQVRCSDDLVTWNDCGPLIIGDGAVIWLDPPTDARSVRFYRLDVLGP